MVNTTTELLTVDGVVLNTLAKNIDSLTGRLRVAGLRGENAQVPGRHGTIWSRTKVYDEGEITLPMWVAGCNDDGEIPSGQTSRKLFYTNLDKLTNLFGYKNRLLDVRHRLPSGVWRQALCEVVESYDFTTDAVNPIGRFSVVLKVPEVFFRDVDTSTSVRAIVSSGVLDLEEFVGATAPMEDMVFQITGPVTNFKMKAIESGVEMAPEVSFEYQAAIPAGQTLTVNSSTWTLTGGGGLVVDYSKAVHKGTPRYMVIMPDALPRIAISGSAVTGASELSITGRRKFLVG